MFNPMQMLQGIAAMSQNPMAQLLPQMNKNPMEGIQAMVMSQLQNDPRYQRAQEMAKGRTPQELEQVARNLCQQQGIDFDQALNQFKNQFGIK